MIMIFKGTAEANLEQSAHEAAESMDDDSKKQCIGSLYVHS